MATLLYKRAVYGAHSRRRAPNDALGETRYAHARANSRRCAASLTLIAKGTVLILLTVMVAKQPAIAQDLKHGEELLNRNCAACHAVGRNGESANKVAPPFRTLGQRYPIESLEEALGEGIMSGHPDMPEFSFDAGDVGAIIAYLKSIQRR
jgi:cytochrome c